MLKHKPPFRLNNNWSSVRGHFTQQDKVQTSAAPRMMQDKCRNGELSCLVLAETWAKHQIVAPAPKYSFLIYFQCWRSVPVQKIMWTLWGEKKRKGDGVTDTQQVRRGPQMGPVTVTTIFPQLSMLGNTQVLVLLVYCACRIGEEGGCFLFSIHPSIHPLSRDKVFQTAIFPQQLHLGHGLEKCCIS